MAESFDLISISENIEFDLDIVETDLVIDIATGNDDGYSYLSGSSFNNTSIANYLGDSFSTNAHAFFRFQNVAIPKGALIHSAVLHVKCRSTQSNQNTKTNIFLENSDDATQPTGGADLVGRPLTSEFVAWDFLESWTNGTWYDSFDFAAVVQEVIDRTGWAEGQSMTVHVLNDGSDAGEGQSIFTYNQSAAEAPELHITYGPGPKAVKGDDIVISEFIEPLLGFSGSLTSGQDITINENFEVELDKHFFEIQNIAISENVAMDLFNPWRYPQGGDGFNVYEYVNVEFYEYTVFPDTGDDVVISENVDIELYSYWHYPQGGDDVAITESLGVELGYLQADAVENVALSELVRFPIFKDTAETFGIGDAVSAFNWSTWFAANKHKAIPRFYLTLTGAPDSTIDITIPISSFQARKRTGNPTYVNAIVPGMDYFSQISARANGEIVIEIGYEIDGSIVLSEEILRVSLGPIRTDEGGSNRAISLSGTKTETYATQIATLEKSIYRSIQSGNLVHRFKQIDPFLNPGDTCRIDNDEFTVDYIIYMVNPFGVTMEVREG